MRSDGLGLVDFLKARLDEDAAWALAASAPPEQAEGAPHAQPGGVQWCWAAGENWEPVEVDLSVDQYVGGGGRCTLRTVEEWPTQIVGLATMPRTYGECLQYMDAPAAGHIAHHDPARVLRAVASGRALIEQYESARAFYEHPEHWQIPAGEVHGLYTAIKLRAEEYADHEEFQGGWRV